jgi:hypothetical protein
VRAHAKPQRANAASFVPDSVRTHAVMTKFGASTARAKPMLGKAGSQHNVSGIRANEGVDRPGVQLKQAQRQIVCVYRMREIKRVHPPLCRLPPHNRTCGAVLNFLCANCAAGITRIFLRFNLKHLLQIGEITSIFTHGFPRRIAHFCYRLAIAAHHLDYDLQRLVA